MEITRSSYLQRSNNGLDHNTISQNRSMGFSQGISIPKLAIPLAGQEVSLIDSEYHFMSGSTERPAHFLRASNGDVASKINIDPAFSAALEKIKNNSYGRAFYNKIISHPELNSLSIDDPAIPASVRKGLGMSPTANTNFTNRGTAGIDAFITMDKGMTATIVTETGEKKSIGTDAVLFHELAHIWVKLNHEVDMSRSNSDWRKDVENKASEYEGKYGGYERDYYAPGGSVHW